MKVLAVLVRMTSVRFYRPNASSSVTSTVENDFPTHVRRLLSEVAELNEAGEDLQRRLHDTLLEGYGQALALEGERRQLRLRRVELAERSDLDEATLRELASLVRQEAHLASQERAVRELVGQLRERYLLGDDPATQRLDRGL
jgi:hypothetical protein